MRKLLVPCLILGFAVLVARPASAGGLFHRDGCGDSCAPACSQPKCHKLSLPRLSCRSSCAQPACEPCGDPCGDSCGGHHFGSRLRGLFRGHGCKSCGSSSCNGGCSSGCDGAVIGDSRATKLSPVP